MSSSANSIQVGGDHYRSKAIQHWDFVAARSLGYFEGVVTKYICRWRQKGGVEDLRKAAHYLDKLAEEVTLYGYKCLTDRAVPPGRQYISTDDFIAAQGYGQDSLESTVLALTAEWGDDEQVLAAAKFALGQLIAENMPV